MDVGVLCGDEASKAVRNSRGGFVCFLDFVSVMKGEAVRAEWFMSLSMWL